MLDPQALAALNMGIVQDPPPVVDDFDYYLVQDLNLGKKAGWDEPNKRTAIAYIQSNPDEEITKKFFPRTYTLCLINSALYWRCPKPAKLTLPQLTRLALIPEGSVAGLEVDLDWYNVGFFRDPNAIEEGKRYLRKTPGDQSTKDFDGRAHRIRLVNTELYWSVPKAPVVAADPRPRVEDNPTFDWLLYETRVNAEEFQKEKVALAYGLYAVPLDFRAEVVASRTLPDILVQAFFPGMSGAEVQAISEQSCRWRGAAGMAVPEGPNSPASQLAARTEVMIHAPRMMIMPYNYFANDTQSYAIGTVLDQEILPGPAFRLQKFWPLWETASRSSVSRIEATTEADLVEGKRLAAEWTYRSKNPPQGNLPPECLGKTFAVGAYDNCYSVKTGVRWLGSVPQGSGDPGGGKDVLEVNALLASMRSDWIEHVEDTVGTAAHLVVLRELLTVTFPNSFRNSRDGYQIRDLRPLDAAKMYFPPLSIPFGGQPFVAAYNAQHAGEPLDFETFWENYYARAVGKAKAELLLRYGLQLTTPNPQNFLLEFDRPTLVPTGRVFIRDIGDAKLHSEVIGQIGLGHPVIQYELNDPSRPGYLPAQTNNQGRAGDHARHDRFDQYPLNTRTHWHQYSTFKDKYGGKYLPQKMMTTVRWGRAHYSAYVDHLATRLEEPTLRLPIFGNAAYDHLMASPREPEPNASKGERAKQVLTQAKAAVGGDLINVTPGIYAEMIHAGRCTEVDVGYCEWALEVHTDEILHEMLGGAPVLAKVRAKWTR